MAVAHTLFHHDSRHLLGYLHQQPTDRREQSLILCTALMRAAALDLNEQGDVWARVAEHRAGHLNRPPDQSTWDAFTGNVRHLILGAARDKGVWHAAFHTAGASLRHLRETGGLIRGLRSVIALHVIFHWNRLGLPATTQAALAHAATEAIFGTAPTPSGERCPRGVAATGTRPSGGVAATGTRPDGRERSPDRVTTGSGPLVPPVAL
jgi:thiopeptide-type bacteriocin biosynthesis protein